MGDFNSQNCLAPIGKGQQQLRTSFVDFIVVVSFRLTPAVPEYAYLNDEANCDAAPADHNPNSPVSATKNLNPYLQLPREKVYHIHLLMYPVPSVAGEIKKQQTKAACILNMWNRKVIKKLTLPETSSDLDEKSSVYPESAGAQKWAMNMIIAWNAMITLMDKKGPKCDWSQCLAWIFWWNEICSTSRRFCENYLKIHGW